MADVASLSFDIDSSQAQRANAELERMKTAAGATDLSMADMRRTLLQLADGFSDFTTHATSARGQLIMLSSSVEGVVTTLQAARNAIDGTRQAFEQFERARDGAMSFATALGTTAVGLEAYSRAAAQLNMNSFDTAVSLQRITTALENQTGAARQLRDVLRDFGVNLTGMGVGNADQVLTTFVQNLRQFQTTPETTRQIQQVLGPLDPAALAAVNSPMMETVADRERRLRVMASNRQVAENMDEAARRDQAAQIQHQRMQDFEGEAFRGAFDLNRLSPDQMNRVWRGMDQRPGDLSNGDTRYQVYQYLQNKAPDDLRGAARTSPWPWDLSTRMRGTWADRFFNQREMADSQQSLFDVQLLEEWNRGGIGGLIRGLPAWGSGTFQSQMGLKPDLPRAADGRPALTDAEAFGRRRSQAEALAGYGFGEGMAATGAEESLRGLTAGEGRDTPSDAFGSLTDFWSNILGDRGAGVGEAGSRYANRTDILGRLRRYATQPGGAEIDQLGTQGWLRSIPFAQRGQAQRLLEFARANQVSTGAWAGSGWTPASLLSGSFSGPGSMSEKQIAGFNARETAFNAGSIAESNEALGLVRSQQGEISAAAPGGAGAIDDVIAKQQALTAAMKANNDEATATVIANNAVAEAILKRGAALDRTIAATRADTAARGRSAYAALGAPATAAGQFAAQFATEDYNAIEAERLRAGGALDPAREAEIRANQGGARGASALGGAAGLRASAGTELEAANRALEIAKARVDQQARLGRELETTASFEKQIAEAKSAAATDGGAALRQVEAQIEAVKRLKEEIAAVNLTAKAFQIGNAAQGNADFTNILSQVPPQFRAIMEGFRPLADASRAAGGPRLAGPRATAANMEGRGRELYGAFLGMHWTPQQAVAGVADAQAESGFDTRAHNDVAGGHTGLYQLDAGRQATFRRVMGKNVEEASIAEQAYFKDWEMRDAAGGEGRAGAALTATRGSVAGSSAVITGLNQRPANPGTPQLATEIASRQQLAADWARRLNIPPEAMAAGGEGIINEGIARANRANIEEGERATSAERARAAQIVAARQGPYAAGIAAAGVVRPEEGIFAADIAARRVATAAGEATVNRAADSAATETRISQLSRLAEAAAKGRAVYEDMVHQIEAENAVREKGLPLAERDLYIRQRASAAQAAERDRGGQRDLARADSVAVTRANLGAGLFATPEQVAMAEARVRAEQEVSKQFGPDWQNGPESGKARARLDTLGGQAQQDFQLRQQMDLLSTMRGSFSAVGEAGFSAFERVAISGERTRTVMHSLAQDIERILLRSFLEKPLENALSSVGSGIWNSLTGSKGVQDPTTGIVGGASAGLLSGIGSGIMGFIGSLFGGGGGGAVSNLIFSTGGVIDHGRPTRYLASGGLVNQPTLLADGAVMAGEVGPEAVMPLRRLPNGDLGIASSGGGGGRGGPQVMVHAPITIQGGGGGGGGSGGGGMTPSGQKAFQRQIQLLTYQSVRQVLVAEQRDGGDLASSWGGVQMR